MSEDQVSKEQQGVSSVINEISGSTIKVETMKGVRTFDIGKLFAINQDDLDNEFASQASYYGFFAIMAAEADRHLAMTSLLYDQECAQSDEENRAQLDLDGKKYTEAVIKSLVVRDEEVIKLQEKKEQAEYDLNVLKAIVRAFEQRALMLQSLGANLRHEYEMQGMTVRENALDKASSDVKISIERRRLSKKSE